MPKPIWLFDLDNTLHNASHAIFPAINANMNAFMARVLGDGDTPADAATVDAARHGEAPPGARRGFFARGASLR
jgi:putative hydrolase of the HAD superfamily